MNITEIKCVLDNELLSEELKENAILQIIAKDVQAIPKILKILDYERLKNQELIADSTAHLSRALVVLSEDMIKGEDIREKRKYVYREIKQHFLDWKDKITCSFKMDGLP